MTMCVKDTPLERWFVADAHDQLWVKREDLSCPDGPNFSKTRGVWAHVSARPEKVIGVLDTAHSQGGWAVARACKLLGKGCVLYYPVRKHEEAAPLQPQQQAAFDLGAGVVALPAGRSAILYHRAKKHLAEFRPEGSYMMPNALKLPEMVEETALEFERTEVPDEVEQIIVPSSSATIAAGVVRGAHRSGWSGLVTVHLGYSRPEGAVLRYVRQMSGVELGEAGVNVRVIDEHYTYADEARDGPVPAWPCNKFYDLKAFRWWARSVQAPSLLWNVG